MVRPDGSALLHARYTLCTNDTALIYVENKGIRWDKPEILVQLAYDEIVD